MTLQLNGLVVDPDLLGERFEGAQVRESIRAGMAESVEDCSKQVDL